jgi:hypothetical protein
MTAKPNNDRAIMGNWSLDELLSSLDKTVSIQHVKERTKRRVIDRACQRHRPPSRLGFVVTFIAASAAAAGITQAVHDELQDQALEETPPRVVVGTPAPLANQGQELIAPGQAREKASYTGKRNKHAQTQEVQELREAQPRSHTTTSYIPHHARRGNSNAGSSSHARNAQRNTDDPNTDDPMRVAQAVRALRKESQPEKARALLKGYLAEHPRGSLAEEALALTIEAALKDAPASAAAHARRYLARYPKGRYQKVARRALSRAAKR